MTTYFIKIGNCMERKNEVHVDVEQEDTITQKGYFLRTRCDAPDKFQMTIARSILLKKPYNKLGDKWNMQPIHYSKVELPDRINDHLHQVCFEN
ncbi:17020_t:CDS:2 [Funneliformis geosporum]|uniref:17020_t:CDS:1 n=1 Tax=Funneliformis geosporum TaxID=1117311 RepID=A0A9W4SKM4_9GLOM|nr:17020_t:CDS:2 [Funneliformis geosporum]